MSPLYIPMLALSIPVLGIIGGAIVKPLVALKQRQLELSATVAAEKAAQYASRTEQLEQRVRVLERIVTDRGADLAGEIERLREPRAVAGPSLAKPPLDHPLA